MSMDNYDPLAAYSTPALTQRLQMLIASKGVANNLLLALLLIAATTLLYTHFLWNPLVFDDKPFFVESTLKQYGSSLSIFELRWLSYASFGWTYNLFGLDWFWYRVGNLALHALTAVLLFVFFKKLLSTVGQAQCPVNQPHWPAFFAALMFSLHPVAVYGVAYLVERSIIMATLFGVAALLCYMEGLLRDKASWFIASALCYFLAVISKEHSIMLPGVAVALTLLLQKPSFSLMKKLWLPYALYLGIGLVIVLKAKGVLGAPYEPFAAEMWSQLSEHQQAPNIANAYLLSVMNQGGLFFKYLLLWVVPYTGWMSIDIRQPFATDFQVWPGLAGFILFLAYGALAARLLVKGGRQGLVGFSLLFPWILFMTEFSSVRIQEPFVLYRSYLWMSGLPLLLLALLNTVPRKISLALFFILCTLSATLAWNRLDSFSSNLKLWSDAVEKNNESKLLGVERSYNNRGFAYSEMGQLQKAQEDFQTAISINPNYSSGFFNIGVVNFKQNNTEEALRWYNKAIAIKPDYSAAYLNRGLIFLQNDRTNEALDDFNRAIQINPWGAEAYMNRGMAYLRLGKAQNALDDLDKTIELSPNLAQAYMNRGIINSMLGRGETVLDDMNKGVKLSPKDADVYFNRGNVYFAMGRHQDALQDYDKAIENDPNYVDAYVNRGGIYMILSRTQDAIATFDKAISLNPSSENAHLNRAKIFASQSRHQEALNGYDEVLGLNPKNDEALVNRGFILLAQNKKKEAIASFKKSCDAGNGKVCEKIRELVGK